MGAAWETAPLGPDDVGSYTTSLHHWKSRIFSRHLLRAAVDFD